MKRFLVIVVALASLAATSGAKGCDKDTPVTPKSQCRDGSSRTRTSHHKAIHEKCSNGEWIKTTEKPSPTN